MLKGKQCYLHIHISRSLRVKTHTAMHFNDPTSAIRGGGAPCDGHILEGFFGEVLLNTPTEHISIIPRIKHILLFYD